MIYETRSSRAGGCKPAAGYRRDPKFPPSSAKLVAGTVTRMANGDVDVTIRELRDRAGLARALHHEGVPACIAFADPAPATCKPNAAGNSRLNAIYQIHQGDSSAAIVIHPPAIPDGTSLRAGRCTSASCTPAQCQV